MLPPPGAIWYQTTCNISFFWAPYVIEYIIKLSMTTNNRERKLPWTMDLINPAKIWIKLFLRFCPYNLDISETEGGYEWYGGRGGPGWLNVWEEDGTKGERLTQERQTQTISWAVFPVPRKPPRFGWCDVMIKLKDAIERWERLIQKRGEGYL